MPFIKNIPSEAEVLSIKTAKAAKAKTKQNQPNSIIQFGLALRKIIQKHKPKRMKNKAHIPKEKPINLSFAFVTFNIVKKFDFAPLSAGW